MPQSGGQKTIEDMEKQKNKTLKKPSLRKNFVFDSGMALVDREMDFSMSRGTAPKHTPHAIDLIRQEFEVHLVPESKVLTSRDGRI